MLDLREPFVMPESVMLRTQTAGTYRIGGCHMAIPDSSNVEPMIGGCHMAIPDPDKVGPMIGGCHMCDGSILAPDFVSESAHREVAVLS